MGTKYCVRRKKCGKRRVPQTLEITGIFVNQ